MNAPMPPVLDGNAVPSGLAWAIDRLHEAGKHHQVPLYESAGAGTIAFTALIDRLSLPNINKLNRSKRPAIVLVGDDDGVSTTGPLGWRASQSLSGWAKLAFIHGSSGLPADYALAVSMALVTGRLVLVETSSDAAQAWADLFQERGVPCVGILPRDGVHPMAGAA